MYTFTRIAPVALFFTLALSAMNHSVKASDYAGGHYETRAQNVLVRAAYNQNVWVAPAYKTVYYNGCHQQVLVSKGYWGSQYVPAVYETRHTRCWVPNTYVNTYVNRYDNNFGRSHVNRY